VLELVAPAKLNLTLEVLGRRGDGYHEIASVMQCIDLADHVRLSESPTLELAVAGERTRSVPLEGPRNLAFKAAQALAEEAGRPDLGARIELEKWIPAGMGLGGGSSDAAAVLRGLDRLWRLDLGPERLRRVAERVGSDVAFFLCGGSALVTGRGETVEALPDGQPLTLTLFVADIDLEDKTRRMYSLLTPADYSDGARTRVTAATLRRGLPLSETDLTNVFSRHLGEAAPAMGSALALCRDANLGVFATGSGPGFFSCTHIDQMPGLLLRELERDWGVTALSCRCLTRAESLALQEAAGG
jgi:4-diphosphocytidyl-2-C-methyl-D-erythritol kinase